jgi:iron complex outermembrane receptor protein
LLLDQTQVSAWVFFCPIGIMMKSRFLRNTIKRGPLALAAAGALGSVPQLGISQTTEQTLEPVVVGASRREQQTFDAPGAIGSIGRDVIEGAGAGINLSESLTRVPGVVILNRQNYAQDLQLSIRGFGARSTFGIRGVRVLVDGIPATMPDGQGQVSSISLGVTDRIEVLRGPLAQLYGNAAGGVVQVFTVPVGPRPWVDLGFAAGSYGLQRWDLTGAVRSGSVDALVHATTFSTDGVRDWSAARRDQTLGRLRFSLGAGTRLTLQAQTFDQPLGRDPVGLTRAQWESNPRQAPAIAIQQDAGKTVRQQQIGALLEHQINANTSLQARLYLGQREVNSKLTVPLAAQQAATSAGGIVDLDRDYGGLGLQLQHRTALFGAPLLATLGTEYDSMQERRRGFINASGVQGALKRNEDNRISNNDWFAQATWFFAERWQAVAGVRNSQVRFNVKDDFIVAGNPDDSGSQTYRATSPVLGVRYSPSDSLALYGQWGRGFETPTFTELAYRSGGSGLNLGLAASKSTHLEIGAKLRMSPHQRLDIAAFSIDTDDEIAVASNSGGRSVFRNVGRTQRSGIELAHAGQWSPEISTRLALNWLQAEFRDGFVSSTGPTVAGGNKLPGVPDRFVYSEVAYRPLAARSWNGTAALELVHAGRLWVNDLNADAAPASTVVNARFQARFAVGRLEIRPLLRIDNLLDRKVVGSVIVNEANGRFFESAPGRNWLAAVNLRYNF